MSFVGTRPEVTKYVKKYTKEMRAKNVKVLVILRLRLMFNLNDY